jgi:hypothetical protein
MVLAVVEDRRERERERERCAFIDEFNGIVIGIYRELTFKVEIVSLLMITNRYNLGMNNSF